MQFRVLIPLYIQLTGPHLLSWRCISRSEDGGSQLAYESWNINGMGESSLGASKQILLRCCNCAQHGLINRFPDGRRGGTLTRLFLFMTNFGHSAQLCGVTLDSEEFKSCR